VAVIGLDYPSSRTLDPYLVRSRAQKRFIEKIDGDALTGSAVEPTTTARATQHPVCWTARSGRSRGKRCVAVLVANLPGGRPPVKKVF